MSSLILQDNAAYECICDLPPGYSRHRLKAIAAEREACAKLAESVDSEMGTNQTQKAADLIRARGAK